MQYQSLSLSMAHCKRTKPFVDSHNSILIPKLRDKLEPEVLVPGLPAPKAYSRNYVSVPQPGLLNKSQAVYSAGVVGGGTVINGLVSSLLESAWERFSDQLRRGVQFFNRGSAADYDGWESLGNPGWGWSGLLPYFKKVNPFSQTSRSCLLKVP